MQTKVALSGNSTTGCRNGTGPQAISWLPPLKIEKSKPPALRALRNRWRPVGRDGLYNGPFGGDRRRPANFRRRHADHRRYKNQA